VLVFSVAARNDFQRRIGPDYKPLDKDQVMTLHSLAGKLSGSTARSIEFVIWKTVQDLEKGAHETLNKKKCTKTLRHIFVDEAQDLSPIQFKFVEELRRATGANLTFVGDAAQCIYQFQGSDGALLNALQTHATIELNTNYRSTQEILDLANSVVGAQILAHQNKRGQKPVIVLQPPNRLLETIAHLAKTHLSAGTVAVIGSVKLGKSGNLGLQSVFNFLQTLKIPTSAYYTIDAQSDARPDAELKGDTVNLLTIHASKGLEFDTVVFIDAHHKLQNKTPTETDREIHKNMVYVAVTRARSRLFVCVNENAQPNILLLNAQALCDRFEHTQPALPEKEYRYHPAKTWDVNCAAQTISVKANPVVLQNLTG
jgi:ATP-dependent exoDNAse (exonuclease V) beta subunit